MGFDEKRVTDCLKDVIEGFSKEFIKAVAVETVKKCLARDDDKKQTPRQLDHYVPVPPELESEVKYSKDGSSKTKTQYWRVNANWEVEVYKDQKTLQEGGEPKSVIVPWNYSRRYWTPPDDEHPKRRGGPKWVSDDDRDKCVKCEKDFSFINRRHHCRTCGEVFCGDCSEKEYALYALGYPDNQRVCDTCYETLSEKGLEAFGPFAEESESKFYGVQLNDNYRKGHFFLLETSDLRTKWYDAMYACSRYGSAPVHKNEVIALAFQAAHRYVWRDRGPWWRWWHVFGTEQEMLCVLVQFIMKRRCLADVLRDLGVPAMARAKAEKAAEKTMDGMVAPAVDAFWGPASKAAEAGQEKMEEAIKPLLDPIADAKQAVMSGLRENIGEAITGAIEAGGKELLDKVLPIAFAPLLNTHIYAYDILKKLFEQLKDRIANNPPTDIRSWNYSIYWVNWRVYWELRDRCRKQELDPMEDALRLLKQLGVPPFTSLNPWRVSRGIFDSTEQLLNDAFFTIQNDDNLIKLVENGGDVVAGLEEMYADLSQRYYADSKTVVEETMFDLLMEMLCTPIEQAVKKVPGVSDTLSSIDSKIPDPVKEFVSITPMFNKLLRDVVGDAMEAIVKDNTPSSFEKLEKGFEGMNAV